VLALTRASFGYFFLPVAVFLVVLGAGRRELLVFLLPVILLQGGWTAKNYYLYRYFSLPATSWTGSNLLVGVMKRDRSQPEQIRSMIIAHPEDYPRWFTTLTRSEGLIYWGGKRAEPYVPSRVRTTDARIAAQLPGNPANNTMAQAMVSRLNQRAVLQHARAHPRQFMEGALLSYRLFWQPIREYSRLFTGPLFVGKTAARQWGESGIAGFLGGEYDRDNVRILQRKRVPFSPADPENLDGTRAGSTLSPPHAAFAMYAFNFAAIHLFGPLLLVALWMSRKKTGLNWYPLLFLFLAYAYVAAISSIGDHGENNRFRLAVEPVIWLLSVAVVAGWWRLLRRLRAASPPAAPDHPAPAPSAPGNS
jgi:hypothetical protein